VSLPRCATRLVFGHFECSLPPPPRPGRARHPGPVTLSTQIGAEISNDEQTVLKVHEALEQLKQTHERLAEVAQMRYFGGYTEQEIAEILGVTVRNVARDWEKARVILATALT
jgi:DNA-directed RNA polymerase specialized sigma24 family protein